VLMLLFLQLGIFLNNFRNIQILKNINIWSVSMTPFSKWIRWCKRYRARRNFYKFRNNSFKKVTERKFKMLRVQVLQLLYVWLLVTSSIWLMQETVELSAVSKGNLPKWVKIIGRVILMSFWE
jgi:hypothetical protein